MDKNISNKNLLTLFENQTISLNKLHFKINEFLLKTNGDSPLIGILNKDEINLLNNRSLFPSNVFISTLSQDLQNYFYSQYTFFDRDILTLNPKGESLLFVVFRGENILSINLLQKNYELLYGDTLTSLVQDEKLIQQKIEKLNEENFDLSKRYLKAKTKRQQNDLIEEKEKLQVTMDELEELLHFTQENINLEKGYNQKEETIQKTVINILNIHGFILKY